MDTDNDENNVSIKNHSANSTSTKSVIPTYLCMHVHTKGSKISTYFAVSCISHLYTSVRIACGKHPNPYLWSWSKARPAIARATTTGRAPDRTCIRFQCRVGKDFDVTREATVTTYSQHWHAYAVRTSPLAHTGKLVHLIPT